MADKQSHEVIGGKRLCGKTTELIKKASREQLYILCANRNMASIISGQAKAMGMDIPFPITIDELPFKNSHINKILVDEVEMILQQLIGMQVSSMSTSYNLKDMPSLKDGDRPINKPLIAIELEDETSVPKVIYKGEEIINKVNVLFDWDTDTESMGGLSYAIEHMETIKGYPMSNMIERRFKGHCVD